MLYLISIQLSINQEKDIDFRTALLEKMIGALDGQRIINQDGAGVIQIMGIEVDKVASD